MERGGWFGPRGPFCARREIVRRGKRLVQFPATELRPVADSMVTRVKVEAVRPIVALVHEERCGLTFDAAAIGLGLAE